MVKSEHTGNMETIDVDLPDNSGKPVVINAENGSVVTVNVNVKNYHYGHPAWFDRSAFNMLVDAISSKRAG